MHTHTIEIDSTKCIGCGLCQRDCPAYHIAVVDQKAVVKPQPCILCGHCVAICPRAAVSITGFDQAPVAYDAPTRLDPQQLLGALRTRRSIRQYQPTPVAADILGEIIEAGRLTPSGGNAQDVSYIVLQSELARCEALAVRLAKKLLPLVGLVSPVARGAVIDDHFFFKKAPVAIVVVSKDRVNAALAAANMERMAQAHGLGVLYSGFFAKMAALSPALRSALGLARGKAVTTLVLGYPSVNYRRTVQREAAVVRYL